MNRRNSRKAQSDSLQDLRDRLNASREELEQVALTRVTAISDPAQISDPAYLVGLRTAVSAALDYGLAALAEPEGEPPPVPLELLAQARLAARSGVSLDAVLRRYSAGHGLLADGLLEEAAAFGVGAAELKDALRALALRYDRILAVVSEEYEREAATEPSGAERRRYSLLRRLLAGEPLDTSELGYDFEGQHLAIVAAGAAAAESLQQLGAQIDRRLLLTEPDAQLAWAWLGGRRTFVCEELDFIASYSWPDGCALACGEPGKDLAGWRLSHRQAAAALPVAQRADQSFVLYNDVSLLAAVLQDDLLAASLRQAYLLPLAAEREAGTTAKTTLRAYFEAARNISSAAALLGVNRRTVASRLAAVEERLGSSLDAIAAELDVALRLDQVERSSD